jgi:hypothetical protein
VSARCEWRPVVGWPGLYEVSNSGLVRACAKRVRTRSPKGEWTLRLLRVKRLKPTPNRRGHLRVMLSVAYTFTNGRQTIKRRRHAYVHTLVAEAFLGPRPEGLMVCHANDKKRDNRDTNLYYGTPQQNAQDALRNGCHGTEHRRQKAKKK